MDVNDPHPLMTSVSLGGRGKRGEGQSQGEGKGGGEGKTQG